MRDHSDWIKDYLRDYTDAEIEAWIQTPDERGDVLGIEASVTGPDLVHGRVVNSVRIVLPLQAYVFHVCPRTGEVFR